MNKNLNRKLSLLEKSEFLLNLLKSEDTQELISELNVFQIKELRNFLENELHYIASKHNDSLSINRIKSKYPSVHDYYYMYDCREELDSCYNETCLAANPNCFSRKMKEQIDVLLTELSKYLKTEKQFELEFEEN
jgi:hypothetical protein